MAVGIRERKEKVEGGRKVKSGVVGSKSLFNVTSIVEKILGTIT